MSDDLESPCSSETVQPELPFFTPPPLDDVLSGIDNLNVPVGTQIPPPTDGPRPTYRDPSALSLPLSSEPTDSTGFTEDIHNTEYSFDSYLTYSTTDYPSLFDVALRDILRDHECNYIDPQHVSVLPDTSTFPDSSSSGTQLLRHDHVVEPVKAPAQPQAENGPYGPPEGISPHCLYTAFQIPPHGVPTDPVDAALTTKDFTGPIRTKPTCRECGRGKYCFYHLFSRYSIFLSSL